MASWSIQPFVHNRHEQKMGGGAVPLLMLSGTHLIQCGLGRGLPPFPYFMLQWWSCSQDQLQSCWVDNLGRTSVCIWYWILTLRSACPYNRGSAAHYMHARFCCCCYTEGNARFGQLYIKNRLAALIEMHLGCGLRWAEGSMYYVGCTWVKPGEYDWSVHMWKRCGLM